MAYTDLPSYSRNQSTQAVSGEVLYLYNTFEAVYHVSFSAVSFWALHGVVL